MCYWSNEKAVIYAKKSLWSEIFLTGVFIQGPFVCNALKKLIDERWEKFLGHFSTKGSMHCRPFTTRHRMRARHHGFESVARILHRAANYAFRATPIINRFTFLGQLNLRQFSSRSMWHNLQQKKNRLHSQELRCNGWIFTRETD